MTKASELRKGNIIGWRTGFGELITGTVYEVHADRVAIGPETIIDDNSSGQSFMTLNGIEPVPLKPEWLAKCGFQFLDSIINGRYYVRWANSPSEIAWYPGGEYVSINTSTGGEGEQPNYTELQIPHIKFVHQLQNLYFALTGEELTIKN